MSQEVQWQPSFVMGMAEAATGKRGYEALRQFAKQLVIGALRDEGDEDLQEVFKHEFVQVNGRKVLARMTFANDAGFFRWLFDEPWARDAGAWAERAVDGLVLIGMDGDARFFYVPADEALSVLQESGTMSVLTLRAEHAVLEKWAAQWTALLGG